MATQAHKPSDPAHPSQPNTNHTNSAGEKPTTVMDAILDPEFLPTLDEAPRRQQAKSHVLLMTLVVGATFGAWFLGFDLLQVEGEWRALAAAGGGVVVGVMGLLWWTGALWIDVGLFLSRW